MNTVPLTPESENSRNHETGLMNESEKTLEPETSLDEPSSQQLPSDDSFEDELDAFDLLGGEGNGSNTEVPKTDLASTARAFNTRIRERKKAQELAQGEAEKAAYQRHATMIQALVRIRKSLRDVIRIDLGERFSFQLHADDWQGWPRLSIRLHDADLPEEEYPSLTVTAHDRQAKGVIEILYDLNLGANQISLLREQDSKRLPKLLRKCVRTYLDTIADIVLEVESQGEDTSTDTFLANKDSAEFEEKKRPAEEDESLKVDLFDEDYGEDDILEALPTVDDVDTLSSSFNFDFEE